MKTILLLRHAKSSWKDATKSDFERPLNGRGLKAAPLIGRFLRRKKIRPDLILSSPAERARQTTALVIEAAKLGGELRYDERIYEASAARLLEIISQIEESVKVALLVGHNPGLEELLARLTGENRSLPTAALVCLGLEIEKWNRARDHSGRLEWIVKPKEMARS